MITAALKRERRETIESVIGTHRAEGLETDPEARALMERYAEGELTLAEFSSAMRSEADVVLERRGQLVTAA